MRVLIIGDIRNLPLDEVDKKFKEATEDIKKIFGDVETFGVRKMSRNCENPDLLYLGLNAYQLFKTDAVYFIPGWENNPECRLIDQVCTQYRIQRVES